ncbi:hypothetical protein B0H63DRAFT_233299 [Podospora didyma]|uniref:Uncharacterized protein n=1 Tax=Podospora didyma TaxID=330526 RepID=A0AAE0KKQ3_9PEZI|nr:hypothetical protein B0H63DRAFT_233299 [Podospora didyma]
MKHRRPHGALGGEKRESTIFHKSPRIRGVSKELWRLSGRRLKLEIGLLVGRTTAADVCLHLQLACLTACRHCACSQSFQIQRWQTSSMTIRSETDRSLLFAKGEGQMKWHGSLSQQHGHIADEIQDPVSSKFTRTEYGTAPAILSLSRGPSKLVATEAVRDARGSWYNQVPPLS